MGLIFLDAERLLSLAFATGSKMLKAIQAVLKEKYNFCSIQPVLLIDSFKNILKIGI